MSFLGFLILVGRFGVHVEGAANGLQADQG